MPSVSKLFEWICEKQSVLAQLPASPAIKGNSDQDVVEENGMLTPDEDYMPMSLSLVLAGIMAAGKHGHRKIVDYLLAHGVVLYGVKFHVSQLVRKMIWHVAAADAAAPTNVLDKDPAALSLFTRAIFASGSIELVKWWQSKRSGQAIDLYDAAYGASVGGHVHLLEWAFNGQGLVQLDPKSGKVPTEQRFQIDLNQVLMPFDWSRRYGDESESFLAHDPTAILEWWHGNGERLGIQVTIDYLCIPTLPLKHGHVTFARWWLSHINTGTTDTADDTQACARWDNWSATIGDASNGNTQILELFYSRSNLHHLFHEDAMLHAAGRGFVNVLEWWRSKPALMPMLFGTGSLEAIHPAALSGHPDVLSWFQTLLQSYGMPFPASADDASQEDDSDTITYLHWASMCGQVSVLDWALKNDPQAVRNQKKLPNSPTPSRIVHWWIHYGSGISKDDVDWIASASQNGDLQLLDDLRRHKYGPSNRQTWVRTATLHAISQDHVHVLEWLSHSPLGSLFHLDSSHTTVVWTNPCDQVKRWWQERHDAGDKRFADYNALCDARPILDSV
ncbi:hypothetical protein BCR44DRAFT_1518183 [Catenaria anguillulae PL171]|uniref:Ankyrin repeat-containing domain protein n=1 Tax=Catenaria anguillulae PL171 TaxID=765915 RepID=A0A1Y2H9K1_9FUNG|nr:hypothetical protein BCR44DRAFT_1518183 [Catenaria anguillulae PL171]